MLKLFNTLGRRMEPFHPPQKDRVTVFTCGPSVYQQAHIGNFRTFLFEDVLVRYLEYRGYQVLRGMNFTDIEDKAIAEAARQKTTVKKLTDRNIRVFLKDMRRLRMKIPDYLPRASEHVPEAAGIIRKLLARGIAYRHGGNIYFAPVRVRGFGRLYGLDMSRWPKTTRRFHRDTYPGVQWNLGDFVLWHGCGDEGSPCWNTEIGRGRPAWNVQDASMVHRIFPKTLSIYCGGIDNLYRHHDYSLAILEAVRKAAMAKYWLHCEHLFVDGRKMSKSRGNILYPDRLVRQGFSPEEIRFFLIFSHYRRRLSYTKRAMARARSRQAELKSVALQLTRRAGRSAEAPSDESSRLEKAFTKHMDNDLDVQQAVEAVAAALAEIDPESLSPPQAASLVAALKRIDTVLQVIY